MVGAMQVLQLWRYPIKSVGGEQLDSASVTDLGIEGDRGWGLVDEPTGYVLTARREPRLLFATCRLVDGTPIATTDDGRELTTSDDWSTWLDRPVRLARAGTVGGTYENPMDAERDADWVQWQGPPGAWHDSGRSRISIVSTGSLGDWDFRRFRSNVLVDGSGEDELIGSTISIGGVHATVMNGIDRCVMVTRPQPGLDRDLDLLRTINRAAATFCVGALIDDVGFIRVGDQVEPLE